MTVISGLQTPTQTSDDGEEPCQLGVTAEARQCRARLDSDVQCFRAKQRCVLLTGSRQAQSTSSVTVKGWAPP